MIRYSLLLRYSDVMIQYQEDQKNPPISQIQSAWRYLSVVKHEHCQSLQSKNGKLLGNSYRQRERLKIHHEKNLEQTSEVWLQGVCSEQTSALSLV